MIYAALVVDINPKTFYAKCMLRFLPNPSKILPSLMASAGFTMIELLVVISVIGVLSVAVLSSINPIEQINKGRDTRTRNDAAQLINAVDRYFSIQEKYPWNTETDTYTPASIDYIDEFLFSEDGIIDGSATDWNWVDILSDNAEVKSGFVTRIKADTTVNYVFIKDVGANSTMYGCFAPASNAFVQEAKERCEENEESSDSPLSSSSPYFDDLCGCANDGAGECYICLP